MEGAGYALATRSSYGSDKKSTGVYSGVALRALPRESTAPEEGVSLAATRTNVLILDGEYSGLRIRKVHDVPPKISVYDLIATVTGAMNPRQVWVNLSGRFEGPDELKCSSHKFAGQGQNHTPVVDARGAVKIINHLSGPRAARFRDVCADIVVRFAEGDESLVEEIRKNRSTDPFKSVLNTQAMSLLSKKRDGFVYMATSPLLNAVKIGMWTGTYERLRGRYLIYYGQHLDLKAILTRDCRKLEILAHLKLKEFKISGELYRKGAADYETIISNIQGQTEK
jgi:hypothetical protein